MKRLFIIFIALFVVTGLFAQQKRILPHLASLTFVKFRIWTAPMERVDNFYVYFNQFKILTDTFESYYDGNDLADPSKVQELWATNN